MRAMVEGGLFVAHELNRATEFCQNSLIAPLEERHYHLYPFGMVKAHDNFSFIATQNPIETSGTYRLSRVLVDRIGCWIRMTYPDKETEIEILKVNAPAFKLEADIMDKIYNIVSETRSNPDLEIPASPRAGIFLTRLVDRYMERFDSVDDAIRYFASSVLAKEMRVRNPNKTVNTIIDEILKKHLR
jgi:MoxR-like ATPase